MFNLSYFLNNKLNSNYQFYINLIKFSNSYLTRLNVRKFTNQCIYNNNNQEKLKLNFDELIQKYRQHSQNSIVVQVNSEKSYPELFNYCSKFGNIKNAFHYQVLQQFHRVHGDERQHYILLEFANNEELRNIIESGTIHNNDMNGVPVISNFLWFRAANSTGQITPQHIIKPLTVEDGTNCVKDKELLEILQAAETIDDQILILYRATHLNDLGIRLRFLAAQQLEKSICSLFPQVQVYLFGSSVNGFGKLGCDLDLILKFNPDDEIIKNDLTKRLVFHTKENSLNGRSQTQRHMETIGDILHLFLPGCSHVRRILQARIPIIKYHHDHLDLEIDMSMSNLSGMFMSELFYIFGQIDERIQPLVFCLRYWAKVVGLTNLSPGRWISNFSLICLIIHFLQALPKPILPSINYLKTNARPHKDVRIIPEDNIDCTYLRDINSIEFKTTNSDSLSDLLLQFFEFYSQFDFSNRAISLTESRSLIKPDHSSMYVINPLEKHLNVSKNVSIEECERFKIEIRNAAWLLESSMEDQFKQKQEQQPWGILSIFKKNNQSNIRPHMFFKTRMVDVTDLFTQQKDQILPQDQHEQVQEPHQQQQENEQKVRKLASDKLYKELKAETNDQNNVLYKNDFIKNQVENVKKANRKQNHALASDSRRGKR